MGLGMRRRGEVWHRDGGASNSKAKCIGEMRFRHRERAIDRERAMDEWNDEDFNACFPDLCMQETFKQRSGSNDMADRFRQASRGILQHVRHGVFRRNKETEATILAL